MERKGKGRNNYEPLQKCSRNDFVSKNFVFNFQSAAFLTSSFISSWSMSVWQEVETDFFYRVYVFFSRGRTDFVVLTRKNTVAILQSDNRRHTDFSLETSDRFHPLNFYFLFPISFFSFTRTSCGWISLETPRLLPFLSYTRSSRCLWCQNAENICVGRGRLKFLVSLPAKGAPFLSKLFLTRKREKVEVWSRFGIVFVHGNGTIPQFHLFCFQIVFLIPLSLVLML